MPLFAAVLCAGVLLSATMTHAAEHNGFRVDLPSGWRAVPSGAGQIVFASPDSREYAIVRPILHRKSDCVTTLRQSLATPQFGAAGLSDLQIVRTGPRVAVARFLIGNGAGRGATLCAETSSSFGMLYGAVVPANSYAREWPHVSTFTR